MTNETQPTFNQKEREVIASHCLWNLTDDSSIRNLLDNPGNTLKIFITGQRASDRKTSASLTIQIPKSVAFQILDHPLRAAQSRVAEYAYSEILSRIFHSQPIVDLSVG